MKYTLVERIQYFTTILYTNILVERILNRDNIVKSFSLILNYHTVTNCDARTPVIHVIGLLRF